MAAVFVLATTVQLLRSPVGAGHTFYAEDGPEFVGYWLQGSSPLRLFHPYAGYQQFGPRLVSGLVVLLLPVSTWAWAMTLASCAVVGAICVLTYVASAELVEDRIARLGLAAIPVLTPIAGREAIGNFANLHWYMPWATVFLALLVPRRAVGGACTAVAACAAALTEIQVLVLAPLMLWLAVRRRSSRWAVAGWAVGSIGQLLTWEFYPRGRPAARVSVLSSVRGYAVNGAVSDVWAAYHELAGLLTRLGWTIPYLCLLALLVAAATTAVGAQPLVRAVVLGVVLASAGSWFLTYYVNGGRIYHYDRVTPAMVAAGRGWFVRWGTAAAMLLLLPLPLLAARLRRRGGRAGRLGLAVLAAVVVMVAGSDIPRTHRYQPPSWPREVRAARVQCATRHSPVVKVPIAPHGWHLPVPCDRLR